MHRGTSNDLKMAALRLKARGRRSSFRRTYIEPLKRQLHRQWPRDIEL